MTLQSQLEEITREYFLLSLEIIAPLAVTDKQSIHNPTPCRIPLKLNNMKKKIQKHCIRKKGKKRQKFLFLGGRKDTGQWIHGKNPLKSVSLFSSNLLFIFRMLL